MRKNLQREQDGNFGSVGIDHLDMIDDQYIPSTEYSTICNCDFAPIICNDFICDYLEKTHGACQLDKADAIDLVRNFCEWLSRNELSCAKI